MSLPEAAAAPPAPAAAPQVDAEALRRAEDALTAETTDLRTKEADLRDEERRLETKKARRDQKDAELSAAKKAKPGLLGLWSARATLDKAIAEAAQAVQHTGWLTQKIRDFPLVRISSGPGGVTQFPFSSEPTTFPLQAG